MKYQVIYKCRLCGAEYSDSSADQRQVMSSMSDPRYDALLKKGDAPPLISTHVCKGGNIGLTDFQGMRQVES